MVISSRTPEGQPNRCPVCGEFARIEPSEPSGDAPCPCCGHLLWFTRADSGDDCVILPTNWVIDADRLRRLVDLLTLRRGMTLTLDFGRVGSVSSATLGTLLSLKEKLRAAKGKLRLRGLHPDLLEIFRITRLDQVFEIVE